MLQEKIDAWRQNRKIRSGAEYFGVKILLVMKGSQVQVFAGYSFQQENPLYFDPHPTEADFRDYLAVRLHVPPGCLWIGFPYEIK